jgi:ADP-heptose:LPS heptosyltransferase
VYKIVNQRKRFKIFLLDTLLRSLVRPGLIRAVPDRDTFRAPPEDIKKILAIRLAYIGDLVMTLPALEALKARFPGAEVHLLTSGRAAPVVAEHPALDRVITYDAPWFYPGKGGWRIRTYRALMKTLRAQAYDLVIDFRGDFRNILFLVRPLASKYRVSYGITGGDYFLTGVVPYRKIVHRTDYHLDLVKFLGGGNGGGRGAGLCLTPAERRAAADMLESRGVSADRPRVGFCPGAREGLKEWGALNFARLADKIRNHRDAQIILFGSESDRVISEAIRDACQGPGPVDMTGRTTLRQLMACLSHLDLVVANDSAPMHLAATLDVPLVALFGPSKAVETAPLSQRACVVQAHVPCRYACDESTCRIENYRLCLKMITPDRVFQACRDLIQ